MGVLLWICFIFAKQLFSQTVVENYFCKFAFNMPAIFFNTNSCQIWVVSWYISDYFNVLFRASIPLYSRIFFIPIQTRSMWMKFCKILLDCLLQGGAWLNHCPNAAWTAMQLFLSKQCSRAKTHSSFDIWGIVTLTLLQKGIFEYVITPETHCSFGNSRITSLIK